MSDVDGVKVVFICKKDPDTIVDESDPNTYIEREIDLDYFKFTNSEGNEDYRMYSVKTILENTDENAITIKITLTKDFLPHIIDKMLIYLQYHKDHEYPSIEKPMTKPLDQYLDDWHNEYIVCPEERIKDDFYNLFSLSDYLEYWELLNICAARWAEINRIYPLKKQEELFGIEPLTEEEIKQYKKEMYEDDILGQIKQRKDMQDKLISMQNNEPIY